MSKRKDLRKTIAKLDEEILNYARNYAAVKYVEFLSSGGCISCDGTGFEQLGLTAFLCTSCEGLTLYHPTSFFRINESGIPVPQKDLMLISSSLGLLKPTQFLPSEAYAERELLVARRIDLYEELLASPEEPLSSFFPGDVVVYQDKKHAVISVVEATMTADMLTLSDGNKGLHSMFCVTSDEVTLHSSINDKLPRLTGSPLSTVEGLRARSLALAKNRPGAQSAMFKEQSADWWIKNYSKNARQ